MSTLEIEEGRLNDIIIEEERAIWNPQADPSLRSG
jgi:hypothetical protein